MAKKAKTKTAKVTTARQQSIGTTLKSLTQNFAALARDAQLVALMELTNLYKRTKAPTVKKAEPPAKKTTKKPAAKTAKKKTAKAGKKK